MRLLLGVALLVIFSAALASAQEPIFAPFPQWTSLPDRTARVWCADLDADGMLDLVRQSTSGVWIHNNRNGQFDQVGKSLGTDPPGSGVAFGDLDGDGDLDCVLRDRDQSQTIVYNNEHGTFTVRERIATHPAASQMTLADVDRDGDADLLMAGAFGYALYLQQGGVAQTSLFDTDPIWTAPSTSTLAIALGDLDGDQFVDLVSVNGGAGSAVSVFRNTGGSFMPLPLTIDPQTVNDLALGDVDGDRDLDLVTTRFWLRNVGGNFEATGATLSFDAESVVLGDLDGDSDLDVVFGRPAVGNQAFLNTSGSFGPAAVWTGSSEATLDVALGDTDGDGAPELLCANDGQASTLYRNVTSVLSHRHAWAGPSISTPVLDFGDVDGDGDPDLLRGTSTALVLYPNDEGRFDATNGVIVSGEPTGSLSLGDVDGDGDLDIARGGHSQAAEIPSLYRNDGGTFVPAWTGTVPARDVHLGDIDGDGDQDLLTAGTPSALFLNEGGVLAGFSSWSPSDTANVIEAIDLDRDGFLDVITGGIGAHLFRNFGDRIDTVGVAIGSAHPTNDLCVQDINGDRELDLVQARAGVSSALFLGPLGETAAVPVWVAPFLGIGEVPLDCELADVDGDGDLDLGLGSLILGSGGVVVYRNLGGTFELSPGWVSQNPAQEIAFADVDGDGDEDAMVGGIFGTYIDPPPALLYLNRNGWLQDPDSAALPGGLPDNSAHLRWVGTEPGDRNRIRISVLAVDAESDPVWVRGQYEFLGSGIWEAMQFAGDESLIGPLATSPAGIRHELEWDFERVGFDPREVVIRLLPISVANRGAPVQYQPLYLKNVGKVSPDRPALGVFPFTLEFGEVTVGDTAFAILQLTNVGTSELVFDRIEGETPSLLLPDLGGQRLAPGAKTQLQIGFAPRSVEQPGSIIVWSNDPVVSSTRVQTFGQPLPIEFEVQLIRTGPELPLGEAVTVLVTPAPGVELDGGYVSYRTRGREEFSRVDLARQGATLAAIIPGSEIRESGLEYFVVATNGDLSATDPPGAPNDVHFQSVTPPIEFAASAVPGGAGGFPVGEAIRIQAVLRSGMEFRSGSVYYRAGGSSKVDSVALEVPDVSIGSLDPFAVIPDSAVGPRGIEFVVRLQTNTTTLFDPPVGLFLPWRVVQVNADNVAESTSAMPGRYRMVTVPLELTLPASGTLEALLANQPEFGPYDPVRWRSFRYRPSDSSYVELNDPDALPGELRPQPGKAFWLIARDGGRIETSPVPGRSTLTGTAFTLTLEPGWNQIGNPYLFPISWERVERSASIGDPVWFDPAAGDYDDEPAIVLRPFTGYFIENLGAEPEMILVSPVETTVVVPVPLARGGTPGVATESGWSARLVARTETAQDAANRFGVRAEARDDYDGLDHREPPVAPGDWVQLAFANTDWTVRPGLYREDLRSPGEGHAWPVEVRSARAGETLTLTLADAAFPPGVRVRLLDRELETAVDLAPGGTGVRLQSIGPDRPYRLTLLAGAGDYVERATEEIRELPSAVALDAVTPNPLRGSARFRFALPAESEVSLEIFDVAGHRVAAPIEGRRLPPGVHVHWWDGGGRGGAALASGVYFYRLSTAGTRITRRLVLVR